MNTAPEGRPQLGDMCLQPVSNLSPGHWRQPSRYLFRDTELSSLLKTCLQGVSKMRWKYQLDEVEFFTGDARLNADAYRRESAGLRGETW